MKEETNNEMDLLLRRLGRRPGISVSDGNGDVEHLDADELNAYAENVLPAAARARYTAHLAECARCRELVVQLSSSAGVVPVIAKTPAPSVLRKFLGSLFSPMVLRYAVPALGLIVVAAIGLFVLRQKQTASESIAQNAETPTSKSFVTPNPSEPAAKAYNDQQSKEQAAARPAPSGSPENQAAGAAPAAPPAPAIDQTSRDELAQAKKEDKQAFATASPAAAAPKPTSDASEQQAKAAPREEASPARSANEAPAEKTKDVAADSVRVEDRKAEVETERAAAAKSKAPRSVAGIASLRAGTAAAPQGQRDDEAGADKDKINAATKNVAGRHFRKQNGVWVDTGYDSSRTVFTVTRGSESYRALIADEPEIKKIAEQLKGEILVVWKDRTYRIR